MIKKKCFKCSKTLPLDSFYKHPQMGDGHLNKCKSCTKLDTTKRVENLSSNPKWVESERTRHRKKYYRLGYKQKHKPTSEKKKKYMDNWYNKFPEKLRARIAASKMKPNIKGNHLHHWSYNDEHFKDTIEISKANHYKAHRFLIYDQERMMYRTIDGVLLDTKQSHMEYILHRIKTEID